MSVNKVIILGRLGAEPDLRYTQNEIAACTLSVATSKTWKDREGKTQESTEWHRVVTFGKQAENCSKYLSKGSQAYIEGKLSTRSWEDPQGNKRFTTEVIAHTVQFIGAKPEAKSQSNNKTSKDENIMNKDYKVESSAQYTTDEIPF